VLRFEHVTRCAQALRQLKPQEARALWLQASGCSYAEIARETGWTARKVNRCLTEGRRSFLARYASIESGAECDRWAPMVSAMADPEASSEQIAQARPHLRNCRALARDVRRQTAMLRAVFPVAAVTAAPRPRAHSEAGNLSVRLYEAIAGGVHERAAASVLKAQALLDATSASKVAAAAASAAALAGGLAVVDRAVLQHDHASPRRGAAREPRQAVATHGPGACRRRWRRRASPPRRRPREHRASGRDPGPIRVRAAGVGRLRTRAAGAIACLRPSRGGVRAVTVRSSHRLPDPSAPLPRVLLVRRLTIASGA